MQSLPERAIGVMFWAGRDRPADIRALGVQCGQLGVPGDLELAPESLDLAGLTIGTAMVAYDGEDYADIPAVERTVGFFADSLLP